MESSKPQLRASVRSAKPHQISLNGDAGELVEVAAIDYAERLLVQSQMVAYHDKANLVLINHVEEARKEMEQSGSRNAWREVLIFIGSAMLGGGFQGFFTELAANPVRRFWAGFYAVSAFVGMLLGFLGWNKR
jgi:hypothetical protein